MGKAEFLGEVIGHLEDDVTALRARIAELEAENAKYLACVDRLVGDLGRETADREEEAKRQRQLLEDVAAESGRHRVVAAGLRRQLEQAERDLDAEEKARDTLVAAKIGAIIAERNMLKEEVARLENLVTVLVESNDRLGARPPMPWQPRANFDGRDRGSHEFLAATWRPVPYSPRPEDAWELALIRVDEDDHCTLIAYGDLFDRAWIDIEWVIPLADLYPRES